MTRILLAGLLALNLGIAQADETQLQGLAKGAGFKACMSTLLDVEKFLAEGKNYGSWILSAKDQPDKQPLNTSMELTFDDGSAIVDITVTPTPDGECSFLYSRTWYVPSTCMAFSKSEAMETMQYKDQLNRDVAAFQGGALRVLLVSAGQGCLVQKKETGFRHKKQWK